MSGVVDSLWGNRIIGINFFSGPDERNGRAWIEKLTEYFEH